MRMLWFAALLASAAAAAPYKETLKRDDIVAIEQAIQAALPPVDQAKVATCKPLLDAYNKDPAAPTAMATVAQAGRCYATAGALGTAIQMWNTVLMYAPTDRQLALEASRELGALYERAGMFDRAAAAEEQLVGKFAAEPGAKDALAHALCIRRQLGDERAATRDAATWRQLFQIKTKLDPEALCATLQVIAMPPTKP